MWVPDMDQLALFDEDEVPQVHRKVPVVEIAHALHDWTKRRAVTKAVATDVTRWVKEILDAQEATLEEVERVFHDDALLKKQTVVTKSDIQIALARLPLIEQAHKLLSHWASRTTVSAMSERMSAQALAAVLAKGADVNDVKYALSKPTLLGSSKRLSADSINQALALVSKDRQSGTETQRIFGKWYDAYYEGRYTQPVGQIMRVIKDALLTGINADELERALSKMGAEQMPITQAAVQYGIVRIRKEDERRGNAGSFSEMFDGDDSLMVNRFYESEDVSTTSHSEQNEDDEGILPSW